MNSKKSMRFIKMLLTTAALAVMMSIPVFAYPSFSQSPAQTAATKDSITVSWVGSDATSFAVEIEDESVPYAQRAFVSRGTTTANSMTISGLISGNKYNVRVTPYDSTGKSGYVRTAYTVTLLDKMRNVHTERYYHFLQSANIDWDHLMAADGYEYEFKNYKGKAIEKKTVTGSYTRASFNKLNTDTIYTFNIRAYMTYGGQKIYTPWESINVFEQAWVNSVNKSGDKLVIKWKAVKGATGYDVYVSSNPKKGYKKVKSLSKSKKSLTIKKVGKTKISKKKKWYVYIITKKKSDRSGKLYYWSTENGGRSQRYF